MSLPQLKIDATSTTFQRDLNAAKKRHPTVLNDVKVVLENLEENPSLGDWIPGVGEEVRKVRVGVKAQNVGKRNGYRLIYWIDRTSGIIRPLFFHFKPQVELIPPDEIARVLKQLRQSPALTQEEKGTAGPIN